jgi:hypothetical protein
MANLLRLVSTATLVAAVTVPVATQQGSAGDADDQIVITGCVVRAGDDNETGPRTLLVWSKGDVFLDARATIVKPSQTGGIPVGTTGRAAPVFYWIDDEDDFAKYVGQRVELVGELSDDLDKGEFQVDHKDDGFTEIEIEFDGRDAKALVPSAWLGPATPARDSEFEITVRRVDVEKVTPMGSCTGR